MNFKLLNDKKPDGALRFLIFGDVMGRPGREAVTRVLADFSKEYEPDSVIVNVENIAHGRGISPASMEEALAWKADVYTTGDHAWDNTRGVELLDDKKLPIIRPANYPNDVPGRGWHTFNIGARQVAVINLQGQVFFKNDPINPFTEFNQLMQQPEIAGSDIVLVDFHAEATSEKRGFGWHADGRASAVWGTHTHIPTADAQILPEGCGYISDVGMCGLHNSVIGIDREGPVKGFLTQMKIKQTLDSGGPLEVNALLVDIDPAKSRTISIALIRKILNATN